MNRSLASWLVAHHVGAVLVTALLGLLPLFGLGIAFFLPGAVPALVVATSGPGAGAAVAIGAGLLLEAAVWMIGRQPVAGLVYAAWLLAPPVLLALLLRRTGSLALCLQVAVLVAAVGLIVLHLAFGDPAQFWAPVVRDMAQAMKSRGLPIEIDTDTLVEMLARTLWGWMAVLTLLLAVGALFLARWWQSLLERPGGFGAEFRELSLGRTLGIAAAIVFLASLGAAVSDGVAAALNRALIDDLLRLALSALVIVGLAAAHRRRAVGRLGAAGLWIIYGLLVFAAPFMLPFLAGWGFVDNWVRSGPRAQQA